LFCLFNLFHHKGFQFMKLSSKIALAASALAAGIVSTAPAEAASFNFSYTLQSGSVLAGMLEGDLQADNDTVFVTGISMPTFNGVAGPDLPFIQSVSEFFGLGTAAPTVSLSGAVMDIIACESASCFDGFAFEASGAVLGSPAYSSGSFYGAITEPYNPQNWTLTPKDTTPIPTPALLPGLLGMGVAALRKRKAEVVEQTAAA
jgi:hypothetical protein